MTYLTTFPSSTLQSLRVPAVPERGLHLREGVGQVPRDQGDAHGQEKGRLDQDVQEGGGERGILQHHRWVRTKYYLKKTVIQSSFATRRVRQ